MYKKLKKHQNKIFILLTIFLIFSLIIIQVKTISKNNNLKKTVKELSFHVNSEINKKIDNTNYIIEDLSHYFLSRIDFLERKNTTIQDSFLLIDNDEINNNKLKEKICNSIIEDDTEPTEVSKGYDCLAQIEIKKKNTASTFRSIRNESFALDAFYNKKYLETLINIITKSTVKNLDLDNFDEYSFLTKLTESKDSEISSMALYRMSLINSLGRSSSKEKHKFDLIKAANLKKEVQNMINIPNKKNIDVLFTLNDNELYINYAKTTIASILLNADLDSEYNFYVIMGHDEIISQKNRNILNSLQNLGSYKIDFITLPEGVLDHKNEAFSSPRVRVSLQKFLVENTLNNIDSIINLDVDIIVLRDLYKLQHQEDFEQNIFAGASEPAKIGRNRLCDLSYDYINTGVIVQNLKLMRKVNNDSYFIHRYKEEYKSKDKDCFLFRDQDAINIIYKDQIKPISRRWNSPVIGWNNMNLLVDIHTPFMPFVIHFTGAKPNSDRTSRPESFLYFKYEELANYESK